VDFNAAVDAAHSRLHQFKNVHFVQADLGSLPFHDEVFDLAYSMRVLHHTPRPDLAVASVARAVKPSGTLAILLDERGTVARGVGGAVRQCTTRLPLGVALALTAVWSTLSCPARMPAQRRGFEAPSPSRLDRHWRDRWLAAFEWSTATYHWALPAEDVRAWLRANGFPDVERIEGSAGVRGRKATDHAHGRIAPAPRLVAHG
jgi:ubiquinone/menaquinone biosynthesis C-methylase UbiE